MYTNILHCLFTCKKPLHFTVSINCIYELIAGASFFKQIMRERLFQRMV